MKSCGTYISSLIITRKDKEKLRYVYIITSLQQGRIRKVAVCIYHYFITTRKDEEKFRYVYIITSL